MSYYNPYQPNMYANPAPQMPHRTMFQEPQYMQQPVQQSAMVWVKNRYEADNYPVAPNTAIALWDSSGPFVHRKETDVSGRPTVKTFKLVEVTDAQQTTNSVPMEFVTRQEFQALAEAVAAMSNYQPKFANKEENTDV